MRDDSVSEEVVPILDVSDERIVIGIDRVQQLRFSRVDDDTWNFDGVYTYLDDSYELVGGEEDGKLFRFNPISYNDENPDTILENTITEIRVLKDDTDVKSIELRSAAVKMVVTVDDTSEYIKREAVLTTGVDNRLAEGQLGFSIRTKADLFNYETGFIATRSSRETQVELPYSFPALYGELDGASYRLRYSIVVDRTNTSGVFNTARRRSIQDTYEIGAMSSNADLEVDREYRYTDYLLFTTKDRDEYDMVEMSYRQLNRVSSQEYYLKTQSGNRPADSYADVVRRLYDELMDGRSGYDEFLGAMTPYGYNTEQAWGEAFAAMDVLKGVMRYAIWLDDDEVIERTKNMVREFVITHDGNKRWIEPYTGENAQDDEYFFNNQYFDDTFGKNDAGEETGSEIGISTWKYYDRVINLGELAMLTQDRDVIEAYMSLMPFVRSLAGEDYFQPVAFYYDTREPATGTETGGSAGGAAMWGYTQILAHELSDDDDPLKETYLEDATGSLTRAHELGLNQMLGMRNDLKPTSIGWTVRGLTRLYELTDDRELLDKAEDVAQGIYHFYYADTNPQTYFPTYGFGYADNRERWEAYLEMATSLWLMSNVLAYTDDPDLLGLYYNASNTHLWALPINGYPYGNPARNYDDLDGFYIPFEFSTGTAGDNPMHDGGSQSEFRQIKQIYGSGEVFLEHQMYEAWGKALDRRVMVLNTTSPHGAIDKDAQFYRVYNGSSDDVRTPIRFTNYPEGNYEVSLGDDVMGIYSSRQLANGIAVTIESSDRFTVRVTRTAEEPDAQEETAVTEFTHTSTPLRTTLDLAQNDASHFIVEVSDTEDFYPARTETEYVQATEHVLRHEANTALFVRVTAINEHGQALITSDIAEITTPAIDIGLQDDFTEETIEDWETENLVFNTDHYMGIAQMLGARNGSSSIAKTFEDVDLSRNPFLEVRLIAKNYGHHLNISVVADDRVYPLEEGIETIEGSLVYDLTTVLPDDLETSDIELIIEAEGQNRSFAIDRVRFYGEASGTPQPSILDRPVTSDYATTAKSDRLTITNDAEQTGDQLPTVEVSFDPTEYPVLTGYFESVRAGDHIAFTIRNSSEETIYEETHFLPTESDTPLTIDLLEEGITDDDSYVIAYELSQGSTATVRAMSLQGSEGSSIPISRDENWEDGMNAELDDDDVIRLKSGSFYPYGEIKKTIEVDLDNAPILNIRIDELQQGAKWALKVQPEGVEADISLIADSDSLGEKSVDLRQAISASGKVQATFKLFIVAPSAGDTDAGLVADYLSFGDSISLVSAPTDQVVSTNAIEYGEVDLAQTPYFVVDVDRITQGTEWRVYIRDRETNRTYELRTGAEIKYPNKYNRSKVGAYIYDIRDLVGETKVLDVEVEIRIYGDGAEADFLNLYTTSNDMIPVKHYIK
ncbi:MAG: hypothetical protein ACLFSU_02990 [Acholeplasmataceae bacterium]